LLREIKNELEATHMDGSELEIPDLLRANTLQINAKKLPRNFSGKNKMEALQY
jgi:hypothetical protein